MQNLHFLIPLLFGALFLSLSIEGTILTQNVDPKTIQPGPLTCIQQNSNFPYSKRFFRIFPFPQLGITENFVVNFVSFGIERTIAGSGASCIPATINTYFKDTEDSNFTTDQLTLINSKKVYIPDGVNSFLQTRVDALVPSGLTFVLELFIDNLGAPDGIFSIGTNTQGELSPSYIISTDCMVTEPTPISVASGYGLDLVWTISSNISIITTDVSSSCTLSLSSSLNINNPRIYFGGTITFSVLFALLLAALLMYCATSSKKFRRPSKSDDGKYHSASSLTRKGSIVVVLEEQ